MGKAFEKQIKTIEDQGSKQVEVLEVLNSKENKQDIKKIEGTFLKEMKTNETKNEIHSSKKW